ncbi:MAG: hypothetical protein HY904_08385 [Deltaproteobacteria bacterium]|nr:hypothetical protein [Deltaproteobacteria bacterium]
MTTTTAGEDVDNIPSIPLDELAARLPPHNATQLAAVTNATSREGFVELGRQIVSAKVVTDVNRVYSRSFEFWNSATDDQKALLVGFSLEYLSMAVGQACHLRDVSSATAAGAGGGVSDKATREAAARTAFTAGLKLRNHAETVLINCAGMNPEHRTRVRTAMGTAETFETLANGLEAAAKVAREFLQTRDTDLAARVKLARLSEAYAARVEAAGKQVREKGRAAAAPSTGRVAQGELDYLDGLNLHLLSEIIHAFDAAHDLDPTIPRLVPIATRRLLGRRNRADGTPAAPAPVPG